MLDREIDAFGRRLGLSGLALSENGGAVSLAIEDVGTVTLRQRQDDLLLSLSAEDEPFDAGRARSLLAACDWRVALPLPVRTGWYRGRRFAAVSCPDTSTSGDLENALRLLMRFLDVSR